MKLVSTASICFLLLGAQFVNAQSSRLILIDESKEEAPLVWVSKLRRPVAVPHNHTHPNAVPTRVKIVKPSFPIPKGKFGIELKDGTKMIGIPKTKSVTLKTLFGNATISRDKISKIETVNGETRVHLINGDRVSGVWVTTVMQFDTQFGTLSVPVNSLVWLRTTNASVGGSHPVSTNVIRRSVPRPTRGYSGPGSAGFPKSIPPGLTPFDR